MTQLGVDHMTDLIMTKCVDVCMYSMEVSSKQKTLFSWLKKPKDSSGSHTKKLWDCKTNEELSCPATKRAKTD